MKKNKKEKYVDDGHTIYNMDVDGMPHRVKKSNLFLHSFTTLLFSTKAVIT